MQKNNRPQKDKMNSKYTIFSLIIIVLAGLVAQAVTKSREKNESINDGQTTAITTEAILLGTDENTTTQEPEATTEMADSETSTEATTEAPAGKQYKFRKTSYRDQHFEKHGKEFEESFGYTTAEEYEAGASRVANDPNALHKLEGEDGDDIYYLEATNEFVIVSTDGYLRTYFRPSAGIDYYNRQ